MNSSRSRVIIVAAVLLISLVASYTGYQKFHGSRSESTGGTAPGAPTTSKPIETAQAPAPAPTLGQPPTLTEPNIALFRAKPGQGSKVTLTPLTPAAHAVAGPTGELKAVLPEAIKISGTEATVEMKLTADGKPQLDPRGNPVLVPVSGTAASAAANTLPVGKAHAFFKVETVTDGRATLVPITPAAQAVIGAAREMKAALPTGTATKVEMKLTAEGKPALDAQGNPVLVPITDLDMTKAIADGASAALGTPLAAAPVEAPKAPKEPCQIITFKHKVLAGHNSEEACSHHKNLLKIRAEAPINASTVCIRVNGVPTRFMPVKGKKGEFLIGAVAGPNATITARYCTGKTKCSEECKIPKDEFLDAIGGPKDGEESGELAVGHWDGAAPNEKDAAANAKLQADMKKELKDMDEGESAASAALEGYSLFADWIPESEIPACGHGTAGATSKQTNNDVRHVASAGDKDD